MADLKKGSTVGGIPIVTTDMINKILDDSGAENIGNKIDKLSTTTLKSMDDIISLIYDVNKNGFYRYSGNELDLNGPTAPRFSNGGVLSLTSAYGDNFMQFLSPSTTDMPTAGFAELYYRNSGSAGWNLLVNENYLTLRLSNYLNKMGEGDTMLGPLTVSNNITADGLTVRNTISSVKNGNTLTIGSDNSSYGHFKNSANIPFHFNRDVKVQGEIYAGSSYNQKVWHAGNFNASNVITKSTQLATSTDLDTVLAEGHYRVKQAVNRPSKIADWAYLEVIYHADTWVLQKIYNFEGTLSYMRTKTNGVWKDWIPMGGGMTFAKTIANVSEWTAANNMYEMVITHSLGSENILSVVLTDPQKYSMNIGFQVVDANKIKVFCGENPTGKIVINATV